MMSKKVIMIKIKGKNERYFVSYNTNQIETSYNMEGATDLSNKSETEINALLENITSKAFEKEVQIYVVDIKEYENEEFKIKQALNKLSNEEILLLGLEEIGFYHLLQKNDEDCYDYGDDEDFCMEDSDSGNISFAERNITELKDKHDGMKMMKEVIH